jgi:hypothetical protein
MSTVVFFSIVCDLAARRLTLTQDARRRFRETVTRKDRISAAMLPAGPRAWSSILVWFL